MSSPLHIYLDVDETLIHNDSDSGRPIEVVVNHVKALHSGGAILYCWSTGGAHHAREVCHKIGIEECFTQFHHKPQVFIDDEKAEEWPNFVHVIPDTLGSLVSYRAAVEEKHDGERQ